MGIESRNSAESQSIGKKSHEMLSAISKQFFDVNTSF